MDKTSRGRELQRFLLVRDNFYVDPDAVRRIAQSMEFREVEGFTGHTTAEVYHPRGVRRRLEQILGVKIARWDEDGGSGNGTFYLAFSGGDRKEIPGVHYDEPEDDITILIYLTPGLPPQCGTSLWQHKATGIVNAPRRTDARRLNTTLTRLRDRLERDSERKDCWIEIDRAGYRYNRMVAYASGMLHSATRHFGTGMDSGRIFQAFRIGVDWSTSRIYT